MSQGALRLHQGRQDSGVDELVKCTMQVLYPFIGRCVVTFLLSLTCACAIAQQPAFHHKGGLTVDEAKNALYSAWNPTGTKELLSPGVKAFFFGSAASCDAQVDTGPVSHNAHYTAQVIVQDTGIAPRPGIETDILTPTPDAKHCPLNDESRRDGSFVVLDTGDEGGAVGLFTTVGPDQNGKAPLVGNFNSKGQSGSGANVGISGTFVTWRLDWSRPDFTPLWSKTAGKADPAGTVAEMETIQTLASAALGRVSDAPNAPVKQVKQQLTVTLINPACRRALEKQGRQCQIQYLFNLGIVRSGVTDWSKVDWFQTARLWIDPAQGNMPVVDGPVGVKGQVMLSARREYPLYTSAGASSQHGPFTNETFRIRLGFDQFQNALRIATAHQSNRKPKTVSPDDMAQYFGPMWNDPSSWTLLSVEVGQEIYNADPDSEAHIGGSFRDITMGVVTNSF